MAILACLVSLIVQIAQSPQGAWLVHSILGRQTGVCKSVGFTPSRIKTIPCLPRKPLCRLHNGRNTIPPLQTINIEEMDPLSMGPFLGPYAEV